MRKRKEIKHIYLDVYTKGKSLEEIFDELISGRAFTKLLNDISVQEEFSKIV